MAKRSLQTDGIRSLAVFLVLPNLAAFILASLLHANRPIVNLDYLLAGVALSVLGVIPATFAYATAVVLDLAETYAPLFHFDAQSLAGSVGQLLGVEAKLAIPVFLLIYGGVWTVSLFLMRGLHKRGGEPGCASRRWVSAASLFLMALTLYAIDALNGTSQILAARQARLPINLVTSTGVTALRELWGGMTRDRSSHATFRSVTAASSAMWPGARARMAAVGTARPNMVLVLVESLGDFRDHDVNAAIFAPFLSSAISKQYVVRQGTVPFKGATSAGEFRELCGVDRDFQSAPTERVATCLPALLKAQGYGTFAFHGFNSRFYDRQSWYPMIGFDHLLFEPQLRAVGATQECGAIFKGFCDADVERVLADTLRAARPEAPRFLYWVTLSSHFPVGAVAPEPNDPPCANAPSAARNATVCSLMRILFRVSAAIASTAADPQLPPTIFVLVGDHAPPFIVPELRHMVAPSDVPFIELMPKQYQVKHPIVAARELSLGGVSFEASAQQGR